MLLQHGPEVAGNEHMIKRHGAWSFLSAICQPIGMFSECRLAIQIIVTCIFCLLLSLLLLLLPSGLNFFFSAPAQAAQKLEPPQNVVVRLLWCWSTSDAFFFPLSLEFLCRYHHACGCPASVLLTQYSTHTHLPAHSSPITQPPLFLPPSFHYHHQYITSLPRLSFTTRQSDKLAQNL